MLRRVSVITGLASYRPGDLVPHTGIMMLSAQLDLFFQEKFQCGVARSCAAQLSVTPAGRRIRSSQKLSYRVEDGWTTEGEWGRKVNRKENMLVV